MPWEDTALAVAKVKVKAKVKEDGDPTQAAIASEEAALRHGLSVLRRGVADERDNLTRFLVLAQGNRRVILCERGIRTFETATRNTLDLGAVALLSRLTHLPVIVDPSHAAGKRELVAPLACAARAVGPDGLMLEIHPDPAEALSDGPQALPFAELAELMRTLTA